MTMTTGPDGRPQVKAYLIAIIYLFSKEKASTWFIGQSLHLSLKNNLLIRKIATHQLSYQMEKTKNTMITNIFLNFSISEFFPHLGLKKQFKHSCFLYYYGILCGLCTLGSLSNLESNERKEIASWSRNVQNGKCSKIIWFQHKWCQTFYLLSVASKQLKVKS